MADDPHNTMMERKPYRPSNGSEGEAFMCTWCAKCERDRAHREDWSVDGCPIIVATMALVIDDPDYPKEWVYGATGYPICTAFTVSPDHPEPLDHNAVVRPLL
ncbi:MAG: hypothetical protein A3E01_09120 [Gammaproteobacteria bacterium RIFCSPHIGHO2_12_FULL_63_22]|nr:MAG: hypothetical protein A3E01_09120 [Gammaproteobacteria bacterium RIFCSPHIGHO2_12_FULL_63_22]